MDVNDDLFINCDSCNRSLHKKCSGLNASEIRVMELKNKRTLKYHCEDCLKGLLLVPKLLKSIEELKAEVEKLKIDIKNCNTNNDSSQLVPNTPNEELINEIHDRQKRINNIILFNVEHKGSDKEDVKSLFSIIAGKTVEVTKVERIGKPNKNNRRALKVGLSDAKDTYMLTKNRHKLKNTKVYLNLDLTKQQRELESAVKSNLLKKIENGEKDLCIRYVHGVPTICQKNLA